MNTIILYFGSGLPKDILGMKSQTADDIDTLIENEKRALAEECFREVWNELTDEGIDANIIAEVFVEAALKRLVDERGNDQASKLISHFKELDEMGFLPSNRTIQ